MKTGILVHGCNLKAENWRHVAWGDPPDLLGRIPQGLLVAWQWDAEVIVFGTGASQKPFLFEGSPAYARTLLEAEYSLEYLKLHQDQLRRFRPINQWFSQRQIEDDQEYIQKFIDRIHLDTAAANTLEEIGNAAAIFHQQAVERVGLVSSPTHIVRCLRDATAVIGPDTEYRQLSYHLFASPSSTSYEGTAGSDVVVVEPPHRPDRHVIPTHRRIQRMLQLQRLEHDKLVEFIDEFDDLLQRFENEYHTLGRKQTGNR